ncbi:MAG: J domain-containing protein [Vicinamibacterales bacterium]
MKTHYELLGIEPSADLETIKTAFRREIARYHPDKVMHLGQEFQEMAAARAAELTAAYKTLTDPAQREAYDEALAVAPEPAAPDVPPPSEPVVPPPPEPEPPPAAAARMFERERAGRDSILRRAVLARVRERVVRLVGDVESPDVRGFDLALLPQARARFLSRPGARVLVRLESAITPALVSDVLGAAGRLAAGDPRGPVVVLLFGSEFPPQRDLVQAVSAHQRRGAQAPSLVLVDARDWTVRLAEVTAPAAKRVVEAISGA